MEARFDSIHDRKVWVRGAAYLSRRDRRLAPIIKKVGYPKLEITRDYYGSLIVSIVSQQISWAAASSILKRLKKLYNGRLPSPGQYLRTNKRRIMSAGISPQKFSYIKDLCERIEDGRLELRKFQNMPDNLIIEELDEVKGIGRWTAEMFLMFSLGRADVFPMDDLGLRKAVQRIYGLRSVPDKKKLAQISSKWGPYGTLASIYLWRSNGD